MGRGDPCQFFPSQSPCLASKRRQRAEQKSLGTENCCYLPWKPTSRRRRLRQRTIGEPPTKKSFWTVGSFVTLEAAGSAMISCNLVHLPTGTLGGRLANGPRCNSRAPPASMDPRQSSQGVVVLQYLRRASRAVQRVRAEQDEVPAEPIHLVTDGLAGRSGC